MVNRVIPAGSFNPSATIAPGVVIVESIVPGSISGIPTNLCGVGGTAPWGPVNAPILISSKSEYQYNFGGIVNATYDMGTVVAAALLQGTVGSYYCVRVTDGTDTAAVTRLTDAQTVGATGAVLTAKYTGIVGNTLQTTITAGSATNSYTVAIGRPGYAAETYSNISADGGLFWTNVIEAINNGVSGSRGPSNYVIASTGDSIASFTITAGGTDYATPPTVVFSGGGGTGVAATAILGFALNGITVTSPGAYTAIPEVGISGTGSGAVLVPSMLAASATPATAQSGSGSYAPGDTVTLAGGTGTQSVLTVNSTKLVSATVAAGGTGGTTGTQTVTGTTGTGTKFQAVVTIASGAITSVNSITVAGNYTVNPTTLTAEPVTGAGLTGATLALKMGVLTTTPTTPGAYTALPTNPVAQGSTSGAGTGATFTITWGLQSVAVTTQGAGYSADSTLSVASDVGSGGAGTLSLASTGSVVGVTFSNRGKLYSSNPTVTFTGGGGTGAAATASISASSTPAVSTTSYIYAGGTNGNDGVTDTTLVGTDGYNPTGMYALANTGISMFTLADCTSSTTFPAQNTFGELASMQSVLTGPSGESLTAGIARKSGVGISNDHSVYLLGDYCRFLDVDNKSITRLISPQGFYLGKMANLAPEQSPLNKPMNGIISTQRSELGLVYSTSDYVRAMQNGVEIISSPIPSGKYFGCETGKSAGLELSTNNVFIQRMANFLACSLDASGIIGSYIGRLNRPDVRASARDALSSFFSQLIAKQQVKASKVTLDDTNNTDESESLGLMNANVQVQLFNVIIVFLIDLQVGTSRIISIQQNPNVPQ